MTLSKPAPIRFCNNFPGPRSQVQGPILDLLYVLSLRGCDFDSTILQKYLDQIWQRKGSFISPLWVHSVFGVWLKLPLTLTWATRSYWWVNYTPNRKVVFCSMDLLWWTCWLLHSHVYIFKHFSVCMHLYISAVMMSVWLKTQIKHFSSQNGPKLIFPI